MQFLADMGISLRTVDWLRDRGHDVVHLRDEGLQRLPDDEILEKARLENRILLTVDLDFAQLLAIAQSSLPSVILFRLGNENYDQIDGCLEIILETCAEDLQSGAMISVNTKGFRIRVLPIG
jgi:predicted nuclease of predicted toxin-antitoxin system